MNCHYQIVQKIEGQFVVTEPKDIFAWADVAGRKIHGLNSSNRRQRIELHGQPIIQGLLGPMYNGTKDGQAVIRYEDAATYDALST